MTVYELNKEGGRGRRCGGQEASIERTAFLSFDNNQENWLEFRRVFKDLNKASKQGAELELAQLASKLPAEGKRLIPGVKSPK